jgi:hypothetical protein
MGTRMVGSAEKKEKKTERQIHFKNERSSE